MPCNNCVDIITFNEKYKIHTKCEVIFAVKYLDSQEFSNKKIQKR